MRSVADDLRAETIVRVLAMSVQERIDLALRLGDDDLELFAQFSGLEPDDARRRLAASRQAGRTPSRCAAPNLP